MMMTITYSTMRGCDYTTGAYTGSREEAVQRAALALDADPVDGGYRYYADETSSHWVSTADDLAVLGAALLSGEPMSDCYSIWCADHPGSEQ